MIVSQVVQYPHCDFLFTIAQTPPYLSSYGSAFGGVTASNSPSGPPAYASAYGSAYNSAAAQSFTNSQQVPTVWIPIWLIRPCDVSDRRPIDSMRGIVSTTTAQRFVCFFCKIIRWSDKYCYNNGRLPKSRCRHTFTVFPLFLYGFAGTGLRYVYAVRPSQ